MPKLDRWNINITFCCGSLEKCSGDWSGSGAVWLRFEFRAHLIAMLSALETVKNFIRKSLSIDQHRSHFGNRMMKSRRCEIQISMHVTFVNAQEH
ncbi:hypothetical protein DICVIV_01923 [Dictyocaulus viviparus]|uniref:Uncharacterized protein n=1 Tax=Dictyocaulus viviparus TaxID=29172 RepID=A0A0D8Y6W5_DICVI|nr:hypothetical protein DICVIV_01923 [Dictyocaulus viviparus]